MAIPKGKCNKCGEVYKGWALQYPAHRVCSCGGEIVMEKPEPKEVKDARA